MEAQAPLTEATAAIPWNSGLLQTGEQIIGFRGNGTFTQTGGTNAPLAAVAILARADSAMRTASRIGYWGKLSGAGSGRNGLGVGTYNLNAGLIYTAPQSGSGNEYIGLGGTGIFNQSGGTNTVGDDLEIANHNIPYNGTGYYNLSGGLLNATYEASAATALGPSTSRAELTQRVWSMGCIIQWRTAQNGRAYQWGP